VSGIAPEPIPIGWSEPDSPAAVLGVPTRSQIQGFDTAINDLVTSATCWREQAKQLRNGVGAYKQQMEKPSGTDWDGAAREMAVEVARGDVGVVEAAAEHMEEMARTAESAADAMHSSRRDGLYAIGDAETADFAVSEGLLCTDNQTGSYDRLFSQPRTAEAQAHQDTIVMYAQKLGGQNAQVAIKLREGAAKLAGMIPQSWRDDAAYGNKGDATVHVVDHREGPPLGGPGDMSSGDVDAIDAANRRLLQEMQDAYSGLPEGQVKKDRLADIAAIREALKVRDSHLIYLAWPDNQTQMIPAATAVGDPFRADHVSVTVPGVSGTTRETIATMTSEAWGLRREAQIIAGLKGESDKVATIAWVGYQPPPGIVSWDTASADLAKAGAPKLESFLQNLDTASHNPNHSTALFGHSYGSLVSGMALKDGASSVVDNAVLYGSPGFGASSPAQLGMNEHNFFVMTTPDDPIRGAAGVAPLHGWGADPNQVAFGFPQHYQFTHLQTDAGVVDVGGEKEYKTGASRHSEYGQDPLHRMTGYNLANILLNHPDWAVRDKLPPL
jgi:hypothetical protein